MKRWVIWVILVFAVLVNAQKSRDLPSFDVASVKLADDAPSMPFYITGAAELDMRIQGGPGTGSPERINYTGVTLKMLIQRAYNLLPEQIIGPDWLAKQRYSIMAKVPPQTTVEQSRFMLQNLLTERFQIRLHRQTKPVRVYHLVVSKKGSKLTPAEKPRPFRDAEEMVAAMRDRLAKGETTLVNRRDFNTSFHMDSARIADFIGRLATHVDRPVIDRTSLDGRYEFTLRWAADSVRPKEGMDQGPSIFVALEQQLGLELLPARDQLEVLVIDAAARMPRAN